MQTGLGVVVVVVVVVVVDGVAHCQPTARALTAEKLTKFKMTTIR